MLVTKALNLEQLAKEMQVPGLVQRGDDLRVQFKDGREVELTPEQQALVEAHVALPAVDHRAALRNELDAALTIGQIKAVLRKTLL